jgi:hypothetical protein
MTEKPRGRLAPPHPLGDIIVTADVSALRTILSAALALVHRSH